MNQPDWLKSILSRFEKVDEKLATLSPSEELSNRVKALESELATANASITERDGKIATLSADLEKAQGEVNAKGSEIQALQEKLTASENRATEVLSAQGIAPGSLPEAANDSAVTQSRDQQIAELRKRIAASADAKEKFMLSNQIRELLSKKN